MERAKDKPQPELKKFAVVRLMMVDCADKD